MCLTLTFLGLLCGLLPGWLGAMIPVKENSFKKTDYEKFTAKQMRLYATVWSWTLAAVAGAILGSIICFRAPYFELGGLSIHGIAWCGFVSAFIGGFVGNTVARLNS